MGQAGTVWVDVRGNLSQFVKDVETGAKSAGSAVTSALGSGAKTVVSDLGTVAGLTGVAIAGIGAAAIKTSTDFNAAMSGVGAVANASAGELDTLRDAALKAGADTVFSASQAADAEAELVKAGVSVSDVLGGALTGSLSLAAAGQLDLADAATISAQAMNVFGLGGEDVSHIADVLAAGANKSAADVGQLGDALRQGGLVAKQTGLSMEETVGVLSMFADNALIGSDAGTSLKTMLQRLVPQSNEAAEAMADLGFHFFDAKGEFIGIENVAGQLQAALGGLSDEQRNNALATIFGSDAVRGASILMEGGKQAVDEYTTAVNDMGAAQRMAAAQTDNLKGDLEAFSGAVETSLINLGDLGDSSLRAVTQAGTEFVNVFNDFATTPAWDAIGRNIDQITAGAGGIIDGIAGDLADFLGSIDPADVDRVFGAVTAGVSTLRESVRGAEGVVAGLGVSLAGLGARSVLGPLGALVPTISPITGVLGGLVLGSDAGRKALEGLGKQAGAFAVGPGANLLDSLSDLSVELSGGVVSAIEDVGGAVFTAAGDLADDFADGLSAIGEPLGELIEASGELAAALIDDLAPMLAGVVVPGFEVAGTVIGVTADAVGLLADNTEIVIPALAAVAALKMSDTFRDWGSSLGNIGSGLATAGSDFRTYFGVLRAEGQSIAGSLTGAASATSGLGGALTGVLNPAVLGVTAAVAAGTGIYQAWSSAKADAERTTRALADALVAEGDTLGSTTTALRRSLNDLRGESFTDEFNDAGLSIREVSEELRAFPGEMDDFRALWQDDFGESFFTEDLDDLARAAEEAGVRVPDAFYKIRKAVASGAIKNPADARDLINIITELDKSTAVASDNVVANFNDLQAAATDAGIDLSEFKTRFDAATSFEDRKAIIDEIITRFPQLKGAISQVGDEAQATADQIQGLIDKLAELAGTPEDIDELSRRVAEARDRMRGSFVTEDMDEAGNKIQVFNRGLSESTEEGRRNADAIKRQVEVVRQLSTELAIADRTGGQSRQALQGLRDDLIALKNDGLISETELAGLLQLYGLGDTEIDVRVSADITKAQAEVQKIRDELNTIPGGPESDPLRAEIETALNEGRFQEAINKMTFLKAVAEQLDSQQVVIDIATRLNQTRTDLGGGDGALFFAAEQAAINKALTGRRASGGPIGPGLWLTSEDGPEIVELTSGQSGHVYNAAETARMLASPRSAPGLAETVAGWPQSDTRQFTGVEQRLDMLAERLDRLIATSANGTGGGVRIGDVTVMTPSPEATPRELVRAALLAKAMM